jgi:hypothetical protein
MSDSPTHEELVQAGKDRVVEFARSAPRCRYCTTAPAFAVLSDLCPTCSFKVTVNWQGDNRHE